MAMTEELFTLSADLPDIVNALAASPDFGLDGVCFAARNSGLYRSDDGGRSWSSVYGTLVLDEPLPTTAVALSPDFSSDRMVFAGVKGGVLRSTDGGMTWSAAILPPPAPLLISLVLSPTFAEDGVVVGGTMEDGVFLSADRGSSWAAWNFGLLDLNVLAVAISPNFANDHTLFAGTTSGLFRSTNGGRAWREVDFPTECAPVLSVVLSPDYVNDGTIFVGTEAHGLLVSDDRGKSWKPRGEDVIADAVNGILLSPQFPQRPHVLALLSDGLVVSHDGGTCWSVLEPGVNFGLGTASILAPQGFGRTAPLLVGLLEGGVLRLG